ncbi:phage holin family protein [Pseudogracilibacillus auburnensis]|uniref:phage holin family protein n=1 Tax=Pseudogracilibacillus auburnensis TaxID=1494959 RepID=UPI001A95C4D4|nr:phage holin family protein [Pseudogracilibacillus auburnensis]MBO1003345.1 phage holin family protein [Pseudogracilibacillus auburnensis]
METLFKSFVAIVGTIVTFLLGGWSSLLQVLVLFIALDYILGVLVAASFGKLNSKIGFIGITKKVMILALVAIAYSIDKMMGDGTFIRDAVIFFYLANELLSILETAGKTNLPIPSILKKAVETLSSKSNSNE